MTLVVAASGVFGEMQSALNAFWKVAPRGTTVSRLIRARAASLGLVAALGFLLLVSLVISAGLSALGSYINAFLPFADFILEGLNFLISFVLISVLFAAIYKVLPDKRLAWRDVLVGAVATSLLFTLGKFLIGLYIGSSAIASSYGAAGALILVLLWVYYSAQIFLLGAEFTKVYASHRGSHRPGLKAFASGRGPRSPAHASQSVPAAEAALPATPREDAVARVFLWNFALGTLLIGALLPILRRPR